MSLHNLQPAEGSTKKVKRIARGEGSGKGGTATKGHKGQKSRSGYSRKSGFEGGQMPLQIRVPKFGFKNFNRKEYTGINLDTLQALVDAKKIKDTVDKKILVDLGLAHKDALVKVLGRGKLTAKLNITVDKYTESAKKAIESAGGTATKTTLPTKKETTKK